MTERFDSVALLQCAIHILTSAGMPSEMARVTAQGLLDADLYGHTTHGLALLEEYVDEIDSGRMQTAGAPIAVSDVGAVACWDANRLPGLWITTRALDEAVARSGQFGIGAVSVRRSHHIGCLASFVEAPARAGHLVLVMCSDPSDAHVAPYGGVTPVMTPNPIAAGIPTGSDPIVLDISMSITTAGMSARAREEQRELPHPWLLDPQGAVSTDPNVLWKGGSILPIGGIDHGHKGFALGLLVEALTQGLSGHGRADQPDPSEWGASILTLAFAPGAFGGNEQYLRQVDWLSAACLDSHPRVDSAPVRLPGQAALRRKAEALESGLALYPGIIDPLTRLAERFGQSMPKPIT